MPYVAIKSGHLMENIDTKILNETVCEQLNVPKSKVKISWEIFHDEHYCNYVDADDKEPTVAPVIEITLSKRNSRSFTEELVHVMVKETAAILQVDEGAILVLIHTLDEGQIFLNGKFV